MVYDQFCSTTDDQMAKSFIMSVITNDNDEVTRKLDLSHSPDRAFFNNQYVAPLNYAAYMGHCDIVTSLLKYGADPNTCDISELTPLHCALYMERFDVAELLVYHGADINGLGSNGLTVLQYMINCGVTGSINWLIAKGAKFNRDNDKISNQYNWVRPMTYTGSVSDSFSIYI